MKPMASNIAVFVSEVVRQELDAYFNTRFMYDASNDRWQTAIDRATTVDLHVPFTVDSVDVMRATWTGATDQVARVFRTVTQQAMREIGPMLYGSRNGKAPSAECSNQVSNFRVTVVDGASAMGGRDEYNGLIQVGFRKEAVSQWPHEAEEKKP